MTPQAILSPTPKSPAFAGAACVPVSGSAAGAATNGDATAAGLSNFAKLVAIFSLTTQEPAAADGPAARLPAATPARSGLPKAAAAPVGRTHAMPTITAATDPLAVASQGQAAPDLSAAITAPAPAPPTAPQPVLPDPATTDDEAAPQPAAIRRAPVLADVPAGSHVVSSDNGLSDAQPALPDTMAATGCVPVKAPVAHPPFDAADASALVMAGGGGVPAASADAAPRPVPREDRLADPASPAAQVGSVLLSLSTGPEGVHRLALRLDPGELGVLHIKVERQDGGPIAVSLSAERPETLAMLMRDQPELHRALDQAGIPSEGRQLTFHAMPAAAAAEAFQPQAPQPGKDAASNAMPTNDAANFAGAGSDRNGAQGRPFPQDRASAPRQAMPDADQGGLEGTIWLPVHRLGINITA